MKRIKIMLTTVTVLAVVGGALAFEAKKNSQMYCTTATGKTAGTTACPLFSESSYRITTDNPAAFNCTISNNTPCNVLVSQTFIKE